MTYANSYTEMSRWSRSIILQLKVSQDFSGRQAQWMARDWARGDPKRGGGAFQRALPILQRQQLHTVPGMRAAGVMTSQRATGTIMKECTVVDGNPGQALEACCAACGSLAVLDSGGTVARTLPVLAMAIFCRGGGPVLYLAHRPYVTCTPACSRDARPGTSRYRYTVRAVSTCSAAMLARPPRRTQDQDPPINPDIRLRLALSCSREKRLPGPPLPLLCWVISAGEDANELNCNPAGPKRNKFTEFRAFPGFPGLAVVRIRDN